MDDITDLTTLSGTGLTRRPSSKKSDVALLGKIIGTYIAPVQISHDYRARWEVTVCPVGVCRLGDGAVEASLRYLDHAKSIHASWLRCYAQIEATHLALSQMLMASDRVDPLTASRLITALFAALGKKKSEQENALLLAATVDMFSPLDASVGIATGLWSPINTHPFVLAVAIKALIAKAVFTSPAELRAEIKHVTTAIERAAWAMESIGEMIWRADEIVFAGDRAAWDSNYAGVSSNVARAMRDNLVEEDPFTDDDGTEIPPTARWAALDALANGAPE
jgi:hypothetical protein